MGVFLGQMYRSCINGGLYGRFYTVFMQKGKNITGVILKSCIKAVYLTGFIGVG